jgi:hypothetical protein
VAQLRVGDELYQGCRTLGDAMRHAFWELLAVSLHRETARAVNRRAHLLWSPVGDALRDA